MFVHTGLFYRGYSGEDKQTSKKYKKTRWKEIRKKKKTEKKKKKENHKKKLKKYAYRVFGGTFLFFGSVGESFFKAPHLLWHKQVELDYSIGAPLMVDATSCNVNGRI